MRVALNGDTSSNWRHASASASSRVHAIARDPNALLVWRPVAGWPMVATDTLNDGHSSRVRARVGFNCALYAFFFCLLYSIRNAFAECACAVIYYARVRAHSRCYEASQASRANRIGKEGARACLWTRTHAVQLRRGAAQKSRLIEHFRLRAQFAKEPSRMRASKPGARNPSLAMRACVRASAAARRDVMMPVPTSVPECQCRPTTIAAGLAGWETHDLSDTSADRADRAVRRPCVSSRVCLLIIFN